MGQFSWLDCRDGSQVVDDIREDVYFLIPQEFGGGAYHERYYEGYGMFDGIDAFEEVARWNRAYFVSHPDFFHTFKCEISIPKEDEERYLSGDGNANDIPSLREIGIILACYDKDNERLPYPIKITHYCDASYEYCSYSPSDPNQGWPQYDEEDDEYEEDWEEDYEEEDD